MANMRRHDAATEALIGEQYRAGQSSLALARLHGGTDTTIRNVLQRQGVGRRPNEPVLDAVVDQVAALYAEGQSLARIASAPPAATPHDARSLCRTFLTRVLPDPSPAHPSRCR